MQTNMSRQLVVLLFFETPIIESLRLLCKSFFKRFQQEIYEAGIIQYTMNVGTQAGVTSKTSLRRTVFQYIKKIGRSAFYHSSSSHVYLVSFIPAFHFLAFLTETDFRRAERCLPDFRCGGFKEMVRIRMGNRPVGVLTAGELAARCHQSETVFRRRFKEEFGQPVSEWLRERRKEEILAMLSDAEIPLSVVATRNGFHSLSTLADYCQRNFGKSPSQIRKSTAG